MKHDLKTNNFERKVTRIYAILACTAMVMMVTAVPALAADDPLAVETLAELSGLEPGELAALLVGLELAGAVRQLPGNRYMKTR